MSQRGALRSLSRAMLLGYVRDRTTLIFTLLVPVLSLIHISEPTRH